MNHLASTASRLRHYRFVILLTGMICVPLPVAGAVSEFQAALQHVAKAFNAGNSGDFDPILPRRGKIRVSLPSLADSAAGFLSASQFRYMLDDIFHRHQVESFTFDTADGAPREEGTTVTAQVELRTQAREILHLNLQLVFVDTSEGWLLREFREHARARP